jgi:subtilisin family serine protease
MHRLVALLGVAGVLALAPGALAATDPLRGDQWGLDMIEVDGAHQRTTGAGAVVAVIDSGVEAAHDDLDGRLLSGWDFVDSDSTPDDGEGHGTHVTGIVAATADNGRGVSSVAPGAKVLPLRVLDDEGTGDFADIAAAIDMAVDQGADVINLSLGPDVPVGGDPAFDAAVDRALDAGVVVVAAAGNNQLPTCEQPSSQGRLLCVGAVDRSGSRSFFSNFGLGLGLMAPGGAGACGSPEDRNGQPCPDADEDILSTYRGNRYDVLAGTSQSTPFVSGVAALVVSLGVRGQAARERILDTATDAGLPGPDAEYGAGIVNAGRAVAGLGGGSGGGEGAGGGGTGDGGTGGGSAARISMRRVQSIRGVLRRGIRVRCRAAGAGRCIARVTKHRRRIARGAKRLRPGRSVVVSARATRRGKRILRRARRSFKVLVRVKVPGARTQIRKIKLKR